MLFYNTNEFHSLTKGAIVHECAVFVSPHEITTAIAIFDEALDTRLSKRNKSDDQLSKQLADFYHKMWSMTVVTWNVQGMLVRR